MKFRRPLLDLAAAATALRMLSTRAMVQAAIDAGQEEIVIARKK